LSVTRSAYWQGKALIEINGEDEIDYSLGPADPNLNLDFLVRFLNLDFEKFDELIANDWLRIHLTTFYLNRGESIDELRAIQQELLTDLLPMVSGDASVHEIDKLLFQLVRKITSMGLRSQWELARGDPKFLFFPDRADSRGIERALRGEPGELRENREVSRLGRGQGILRIGDGRWIVKPLRPDNEKFRDSVYSDLISTLVDGTFSRFRRCLRKACSQFYYADDERQKYCALDCGKLEHAANRNHRMAKSREAKREREKKRALAFKREQQIAAFGDFLKRADSRSPLADISLHISRLGKGEPLCGWKLVKQWIDAMKRGVEIAKIFTTISAEHRVLFEQDAYPALSRMTRTDSSISKRKSDKRR
jgi:hypothetical protein